MDIITHTLSGVLVGATIASCTNHAKSKVGIIFSGALGGCLPDIDAISLWSGFDDTIGTLLHLSHAGHEIYFGKFWYSHHGFFHSIAAIICYLLLFSTVKSLISKVTYTPAGTNIYNMSAFSGGYLAHILEDLPTPGGSWGGINMFWPSSEWIGGTGQVWWWNNYDIFLIILISSCMNVLMAFWHVKWNKAFSTAIFCAAILLVIVQINHRNFDFNTDSYGSKESVSLDIQKKILGENFFDFMVKLDNKIKINF